ncbi:hypothetical protein PENSPDRAFT_659002 [Peniophora sp. CONT]|nr:hypothetical protein PENSPDRAFT_659002 [Peniophora sp. CONT]
MDDHDRAGLQLYSLPQHESPPLKSATTTTTIMTAAPAPAPPVRAKRRQVKNACTHCQKACKKCDDARPCLRCVKYGVGEECVDSVRKERKKGLKRGPYKKRDGSNNQLNGPTNGLDGGELLLFPPEQIHVHHQPGQQGGFVYYQYPPPHEYYPHAPTYYYPAPLAYAPAPAPAPAQQAQQAQEDGYPPPPPAIYYAHAPPPPYYPPQAYAYPAPQPHQLVRAEQAQYAYSPPDQRQQQQYTPPPAQEQYTPPPQPAQVQQQQVSPPHYGHPMPSYARAPVPEGVPLARVNEVVQQAPTYAPRVQEGVPLTRVHEVQSAPPQQQVSYARAPAQDSVPLNQVHARTYAPMHAMPGHFVGGLNVAMPMEGRA